MANAATPTPPAENKTPRQKACDGLDARMEEIRIYNEGEHNDDENMLDPLSVTERIEKHVLLSWGGPSDGFKIYFQDGEPVEGIYYKANWGEYGAIELDKEEVESVVDAFGLLA